MAEKAGSSRKIISVCPTMMGPTPKAAGEATEGPSEVLVLALT